ncbi:hypothetical protein K432DRAFT_350443 [Lepidopterella palustris CBS 459.81]|uniref:Uncharacterized protein n=1 Tax=Lepidopterella palustris CBS 459.81 TaxID=1314670 RepID=A0A8E2EDC0_9PEZI|nr:hypothetical protein K432DRAFT_350443 [Lepidopterella palustris CBS 459.81]
MVYVTKTEEVVETVDIYTTIWVDATPTSFAVQAAPTSSSIGGLFYEQPSSAVSSQAASSALATSAAAAASPSVAPPVVPSSPVYVAPSSNTPTYVAPISSVYTPPSPTPQAPSSTQTPTPAYTPAPSSTPVSVSSAGISSTPVASSSALLSSSAPASSSLAVFTSSIAASSIPPSTAIFTSVVTEPATVSGGSATPVIITVTSVTTPTETSNPISVSSTSSSKSSSTSEAATLQSQNGKPTSSGGLSVAGKTAIAVVIPVVVVALLVLAGILLWRKRRQRKDAEEARRKEVEEYGFNPNNDPTLPAVGIAGSEMTEDQSGYRGWGNTTNPSNRKASTTLSGGLAGLSDSGSNPGGYNSPGSPTQVSEGHSADPLMAGGRRETMDSETIGALGAAPVAGQNRSDIHRGPSNASSSYSAGNRSDNSGDIPLPMSNPQDYYNEAGYYQPGPYAGDGAYGVGQQPVIRDVQARRNTRIENPSVFPQQGNSGIAQNF